MAKVKSLAKTSEDIAKDLFKLLNVDATFETTQTEENGEKGVSMAIKSAEEAGLLIGSHGATLHALESFLSMALKQKTGEWVRVTLDVDGWREKQDNYLRELAIHAAERARTTGEPQNLYNLNPSQRRTIHMYLKTEKGIATESLGEGEGRYLIIKAS